jgi:NAD(P)-dependent dehydrogenase (short-subunit alcohol dehydrogenase family)
VVIVQLKPVEEQVVALMGASSGIGRETALRIAERGARVVVSARSEEGLDSLVEEVRDKGGQATAIPAEVTDFEQVKAVANAAVEKYGRLDTWVHLAAVGLFATFEQTTPEEFERVIDVNGAGLRGDGRVAAPQARGSRGTDPHLLGRSQALLPIP